MDYFHKNFIAISKALVIILMVIGHSGCPVVMENIIYSFHMPFFFICSGYFFLPLQSVEQLKSFGIKKLRGIYLPFIEWCLLFILLHNVFYYYNLYNDQFGFNGEVSHLYTIKDYAWDIVKNITTMGAIPQLLGGFWFLKNLLIAALFVGFLTFIIRKNTIRIRSALFTILFTGAIFFNYYPVWSNIISSRDLFWSSAFFYSGYLLKGFQTRGIHILLCLIVFILGNYLSLPCRLDFFSERELMPLAYLTSISGSILIFRLSKLLENITCIRNVLYYLGNHTLIILSLHFLAFKIVNLMIIYHENLYFSHLAEFPIIENHQRYWILYTLIGVFVPVILYWLFSCIKLRIQTK